MIPLFPNLPLSLGCHIFLQSITSGSIHVVTKEARFSLRARKRGHRQALFVDNGLRATATPHKKHCHPQLGHTGSPGCGIQCARVLDDALHHLGGHGGLREPAQCLLQVTTHSLSHMTDPDAPSAPHRQGHKVAWPPLLQTGHSCVCPCCCPSMHPTALQVLSVLNAEVQQVQSWNTCFGPAPEKLGTK